MNLEHSEEKLNKLKTEFPNIPEVFIKRVLRCHDVAANPENLEIVRKELRGFQGIQTPQGRGGVFKKRPSAGQREIDNFQMDDNWKKLLDLAGVTDEQKQSKETMEFIYDFVEKKGGIENVTREIEMEKKGGPPPLPLKKKDETATCVSAKIDDEIMNLENSEEKLNKLKTEFPNIPEVFIKRVLRCHDVAANPENLEIVRKELRGFQFIQTPQGRGGVFKKRSSAGQREVPKGGSIAECGGDLAGRHIDNFQMDDNWKKLLDLAGVIDEQKQSKETMKFIYDFVEKRGGIENVTREIEMEKKGGPPPLPLKKKDEMATCVSAKIDDEIMNLENSEEKLNKLKTEFPNIPEVFIKRVLRCHDVAANPENLEIVRKELRGFQGMQTPQGRGGVFKKRPGAGQREVPKGGSIAECGGDLAGRHIDNFQMDDNWKKLLDLAGVIDEQKQSKETMKFIYDFVEKRGGIENVTREIEMEKKGGPPPLPLKKKDETATCVSPKTDDKIMNLEYSEEKLNKLKTEFPNIPEVLIKRVLRCHDVAEDPENLEIVRKELQRFQGIQTPQGKGGVFKKRSSAGQREVPKGGSIAECGGNLAGRHVGDQKRTDDATQEECRTKIDDEVMKLDYSEETLNKLKTEFPNNPEVLIKRVLRCHDVAANPENLESVRKELRRFQGTQTPQGRGVVFKKPPSAGQREVPIGRSIGECGGDLAGRHFGDHKRTDDEFGAQHPGPPGNLNRFGDPPPTKPKPSQGPIRKPQDISTKDRGEYKECPPERGGDESGFLQPKQTEDEGQPELTQTQGQQFHNQEKGPRGALKIFMKSVSNRKGFIQRKSNFKSDGGQREEDEHISWETFATGSETKRGHDLGDESREQSMSSVGENQSVGIEKGLHLLMAVDPDIMEYVTTTSHHDELKEALSAKNSKIKWTPPNKTAVVVFRGEDETNSWQSECIDLVQSYLRKFAKHDVEVKKEFWEAVKTQLFNVRACLGPNPPLIKPMDEFFRARVICMSTDAKGFEDQVEAKLEEIYREEIRKTHLKFSKSISKERIILLKKIKFAEKLQQHNKELEVTLDTEAQKIYFEGPPEQFNEAAMKFHKLDENMVEKKLSVSKSILKVLGSDEGLKRLKCELEKNNVEAVYVIDKEVCIVGTSAEQANQVVSLVEMLTLEERVLVDATNQHVLKTSKWRKLCNEVNVGKDVHLHQNECSETIIAGFREHVTEAVKKLNYFLRNNSIREEQFKCSKDIRKYLVEYGNDDLRLIETQLANAWVKIAENGKDEDFLICGNKVGIKRAREKLNTIVAGVSCKTIDIKQPGLRKFYASGKGDRLEKSVEKNHECMILVQKSFDSKREGGKVHSTSSYDDDELVIGGDDDKDDQREAVGGDTDRSSFATKAGHQVSWRAGVIEAEKAEILVSSQGACYQAILKAGGASMRNSVTTPNAGDITVSPGFALLCSHVIHTKCSPWEAGIGEAVLRNIVQRCLQKGEELRMNSIAFPVIGTWKLNFPRNEASRIMLEEIFSFCQTNASSTLKDIRFVVYQQDQALITAFKQEMANLQSKHNLRQVYTTSGFFGKRLSKFGIREAASSPGLSSENGLVGPSNSKNTGPSIEVINADLTQEKTDAILNIISTDMNMNNAGELSKAILKQGGSQIQQECSQLGNQVAGSAVMTNGGNLAAPKVIHIIPGSSDKQHLQTCLEDGLRLADKHKLRSLSLPCVGTGAYGLAAADSAQVTFQALNNFSLSCQNVRKVRIVVFQASMMQEFLQAQQRHAAGIADHRLESNFSSEHTRQPREYDRTLSVTNDPSLRICVVGKDATSVQKAIDSLKSGFSEACTTQKVENEAVNQLSRKQVDSLRKKANDCEVSLDIEAEIDRIVVRGEPTEVTGMVGEIWHEINERNKEIKEEQQALLVSKNIEWSYEIQGAKMVFDLKTNAKLEMAHVKSEAFVRVPLRADEFDINLKAKTGQGRQNGETITIHRKVKGADEGIPLPEHWDPMPYPDMTVHLVPLLPSSSEYQSVVSLTNVQVNIQKIERIQNPHLYQSYVVRKQKIDQNNGGNNERQLFHGTKGENVKAINTQGFNRRFCGQNGVKFGQGVYFSRDASYSVHYTMGGAGSHYMYLARVLVGKYCVGDSAMKNPPPKDTKRPEILYDSVVNDTSNPSIFVVFHDTQYYPEYLITFSR
ncbi:uncharacterized protein [Montipora foliosa]|uniref:uncharacterized protein isoform X3 n=1 Tax=Montipora foliosa TaxID=591990 RepID=UPI0035F1E835